MRTRSRDPREHARRARRKLGLTSLRRDMPNRCYDAACLHSRCASDVAAARSVWRAFFLFINVFILVVSCMCEYVVCVVTLIRTCVHTCMRNGGRHCPLQKVFPKMVAKIAPKKWAIVRRVSVCRSRRTQRNATQVAQHSAPQHTTSQRGAARNNRPYHDAAQHPTPHRATTERNTTQHGT